MRVQLPTVAPRLSVLGTVPLCIRLGPVRLRRGALREVVAVVAFQSSKLERRVRFPHLALVAGAARRSSTWSPSTRRGFNSPHPLYDPIFQRRTRLAIPRSRVRPPVGSPGQGVTSRQVCALVRADPGMGLLNPLSSARLRASAPSSRPRRNRASPSEGDCRGPTPHRETCDSPLRQRTWRRRYER